MQEIAKRFNSTRDAASSAAARLSSKFANRSIVCMRAAAGHSGGALIGVKFKQLI
jgi:hypothetical protein